MRCVTRMTIALATPAFAAAACSTRDDAGLYGDGCHTGDAEGSRCAKSTGDSEMRMCSPTNTLPPGYSNEELCSKPWNRAYPVSTGERFCGDHMPDGLKHERSSTDQRSIFSENAQPYLRQVSQAVQ